MTKSTGHTTKIAIAAAITMSTIGLVGASTASATHTHSKATGNGSCVLLARKGGEQNVALPHADEYAVGRQHPLHVNVHFGEPELGGHIEIGVEGTLGDPCYNGGDPIDYLND